MINLLFWNVIVLKKRFIDLRAFIQGRYFSVSHIRYNNDRPMNIKRKNGKFNL